MKYRLIIIVLTIIAFFLNCSRDETYTIEIKDGVRHIHNHAPLWGDTLKVALEFVQKIGNLESENDNYILFNPTDVARDADGNLYVMDMGYCRVQKFNPEGGYLATFGRQGQGPGELGGALSIDVGNDGNIYVADLANQRIQKYSPQGDNLGSFRIGHNIDFLRLLTTGELATKSFPDIDRDTSPSQLFLVNIIDLEGNILKKLGKQHDYRNPMINAAMNDIFIDVDNNDNIHITFRCQNRIEKYSKLGELVFKTDRPLNFDVSDKPVYLKMEAPGREAIEIPYFYPVSDNIAIDGKGRIWVTTYQKKLTVEVLSGENPFKDVFKFTVFDENGIFLGEIPLPKFFDRMYMRIFQDRLYLVDSIKEMCVYEYKIVEK